MNDLIGRLVAIDALDALCDRECEYSKKQRSVMCGACHLGSAFDVVEQLPSVEPVIIRCKECLMHGVCRFEQGLGLDGYCSQAERRTDENNNE